MIYHKLPMADGSEVDLTLNLGALAELNKRNKSLADRYFELTDKMNSKGSGFNELDMAEMIYIAYACAHPDEAIPEKNEFLMEITDSRQILGEVFQQLFGVQKKKTGFSDAFESAAKKTAGSIKLPKFKLEDLEDYYTYYVLILKIPEQTFWDSDIQFLNRIAKNKAAYDGWLSYAIKKEGERKHG